LVSESEASASHKETQFCNIRSLTVSSDVTP